MSLYNLAVKYDTDKGSHGYCQHYELLTSPRVRLLEMGIGGCGSLKMWKDWFPDSEIIGFDHDSGACERARTLGFEAIRGDQSRVDDLSQIRGEFNIIVDDAGHDNEAQKTAFKFLWPKVLKDGWYIIEDLQIDKIHNSPSDSVEAITKSEGDVREVHHIHASGGSAILFLRKR